MENRVVPGKVAPRGALEISEEEQFVLHNGAAHGVAELGQQVFRILRRGLEKVSRLQPAVGVVHPAGPMEIVCPGLNDDVDGGAAGQPLLGVESISDDIHRLNAFRGGDVGRIGR